MPFKEKVIHFWKTASLKLKIACFFVLLILLGATAIAAEKASETPASCAICHNMQSHYDSWHSGSLSAKKHADAGVTCHDCHPPKMSQQIEEGIKYITGDYDEPMKKREFPKALCLQCHTLETAKGKTDFPEGNPHDSHEGEQECFKCHSMHQQSKTTCSECHSFPWIKELPDNWKKGK